MRARWMRGVVAVAVAASLAGALATGAAGQVIGGDPSEPTLDPQTENDELRSAIGALEVEALNEYPDSFAGLWLGEEGVGGPVYVAFTGDAATKVAQLAVGFARPDLLRPVETEHSLAALERLQRNLAADRELVHAGTLAVPDIPAHYDLGIDLQRNTVYAVVERLTGDTAAAFAARYGRPLAVREGPLAVSEACNSRSSCSPDLRSGLATGLQFFSNDCSTGFTVRVNGNRQLLSAAHCGRNDGDSSARFHDFLRYGEVRADGYSGAVDAERHSVEGLFDAQPLIYVNNADKSRKVNFTSQYDRLTVGDTACKSGITTNQTCGEVLGKYFSPDYVPRSERFIKSSYCGQPGDSGGGVYLGQIALGIHSGGTTGDCSQQGDFSIFGHIEFVENRLNATVVHDGS